jgi:hypothetical protein
MSTEPDLREDLPLDNPGNVLVDQAHVVWFELSDGRCVVVLRVEVVWVESSDGSELVLVPFRHEVSVSAFSVPRVERVVSDHRQSLFGD